MGETQATESAATCFEGNERLREFIDFLHEQQISQHHIDLPQIAVMGDQSSGKVKSGIFTVGRSHVSPPEWSSTTVPFNHPGVYEGIELLPELQEPWWPEKCPVGDSETTTGTIFRHKYANRKQKKLASQIDPVS